MLADPSTGVLERLIALIRTELDVDEPVSADTPLLSSGLIDSFDVVVLLAAIERFFHVTVDVERLSVESADTPARLLALIEGQS